MRAMIMSLSARLEIAKRESGKPQLHREKLNRGETKPSLGAGVAPRRTSPAHPSLREKLIKVGAKVVNHNRYMTFQMAEVAVPRQMFWENV
jgi:hypothetical protein